MLIEHELQALRIEPVQQTAISVQHSALSRKLDPLYRYSCRLADR